MPQFTDTPLLSDRFGAALQYASELHRRQVRKGTSIPYISHLLAVTALALEAGADEDTAIAALLHDAVEDAGGADTQREIRSRFGERVATVVAACTETEQLPKPPWRERKELYIEHLHQETDPAALTIVAADKLHNMRCTVAELRSGVDVWARFNEGRYDQLWFYGAVVAELRSKPGTPRHLVDDLVDALTQLQTGDGDS
jgi:GTP pyrophosphokinase